MILNGRIISMIALERRLVTSYGGHIDLVMFDVAQKLLIIALTQISETTQPRPTKGTSLSNSCIVQIAISRDGV